MKENDAPDPSAIGPAHPEQADLNHIRLLLVEDMPINRVVIIQLLQDWWQFKIDEAADGEQAVAMAQKQQYDIILMDVRMPIMDGYQAAKAIRSLSNKNYQQVPIIALTADTVTELEKHPEAMFFTDVIAKPFNPSDLQQKLIRHAPIKKTPGSQSTDVPDVERRQSDAILPIPAMKLIQRK